MRDKELRKLKRQDLLELLIVQSRDVVNLQSDIEEKGKSIAELTETYDRLREKLNEKDDQINKLKERLDQKDARIVELESRIALAGAEGIGDDSNLMMEKIYEIAQNAVKEFMKSQNQAAEDQETEEQELKNQESDH